MNENKSLTPSKNTLEVETSSTKASSRSTHVLLNPEIKQSLQEKDKDPLSDPTLYDLFVIEVQNETTLLSTGLIDFEKNGKSSETLDSLMRAAHSLKGAAKIMHLDPMVLISHAIEDCFVAVQKKHLTLSSEDIDTLLHSIDFLAKIASIPQIKLRDWLEQEKGTFEKTLAQIRAQLLDRSSSSSLPMPNPPSSKETSSKPGSPPITPQIDPVKNRALRVTATNMNRLMGLAGEALVESRWLQPFSASLVKIKKKSYSLALSLDRLREGFSESHKTKEYVEDQLFKLQREINECCYELSDRMTELEMFILRHSRLSDRLYREALELRMRPFSDVVEVFPRIVRDLSKELNKKAKLEIVGKHTLVDRDILEILETPINHLIKNALDHGIECPDVRAAAGKPAEGTLKIEAMHRAGMMVIQISDDGQGIDIEELRKVVVMRNLVQSDIAAQLTPDELLEFVFLPGFSTKKKLSEISGRGFGMNAVSNIIRSVGGTIHVHTLLGKGTTMELVLPITLSVLRALIVEIDQEPYAFPLAKIDRALSIDKEQILIIENKEYIQFEGQNIGLVMASQLFDLKSRAVNSKYFHVIIVSDRSSTYGLIVDQFLGEKEIVVQEFDPLLGKIPNISSGGFLDDGNPVLIVDIEDVVRSLDTLLHKKLVHKFAESLSINHSKTQKKILIVDDSITVREVESRLLCNAGYEVHVAINGVEALNALHMADFDLLITDMDMPRMNGLELIRQIRNEHRFKDIPVIIVSYKESDEDRRQGLEAGANVYLSKSSFHDTTLLNAVMQLIR